MHTKLHTLSYYDEMDNMSLPKGLLNRPNGYYFQARIPKAYLSHYPKPLIYEKLQAVTLKDAIRLVHERWAELHQEFKRIEETGSRESAFTQIEVDRLAALYLNHLLEEDEEYRNEGLSDAEYKSLEESYEIVGDDQAKRLARGRPNLDDFEVADFLESYGIKLDHDSDQYRKVALALLKVSKKATDLMKARHAGEIVETPPAPPPVQTSGTPQAFDTLEALREYWLLQPSKATGNNKGRTSSAEATSVIRKFRDFVGDIPPNKITEEHIVQLKDKMLADGSSPATINKARGVLAAMFSTAKRNRKIATNPCTDMEKLPISKSEVEKPYTIEELQTIFNSPVFTKGFRPKRFQGEAIYWLPLLGLYTGARLNELAQLFTGDFGEEDGINYLVITPEEATGRTNKTGERRRVPIHPDLIKMGFIDYCTKVKDEKHQQLFPELKITRKDGKLGDKWGSEWSGYVRNELGIKRIPKPFHGFRHSFIEHGRRSRMDTELRRIIEGHTPNTVEFKSYGLSTFPLEPLYEEIVKLSYKGLDLGHLFKSE